MLWVMAVMSSAVGAMVDALTSDPPPPPPPEPPPPPPPSSGLTHQSSVLDLGAPISAANVILPEKSSASSTISEVSLARELRAPPPPPPPSEEVLRIRAVENSEFEGVSFKNPRNQFERKARNFMRDDPEMLFVSEYMVDDQCIGAVICWENHYDATHYEVFKKNLFKSGAEFERILFLDTNSLKEEREHFKEYIRKTLGIRKFLQNDGGPLKNAFVMLDDQLKEDRIYEYRVSAARVPKAANEVDYDLILESKDLLSFNVSSPAALGGTIFVISATVYGSEDLAWTLPLVNEGMVFFGRDPTEQNVGETTKVLEQGDLKSLGLESDFPIENKRVFYKVKNLNDIMCLYQESLSLFGAEPTFNHLLRVLGGLPTEFFNLSIESLDDVGGIFSYDNFREKVLDLSPVFGLALDISESAEFDPEAVTELSSMSVVIPLQEGSEGMTELLGLTRVLKFINDMLIAVLNAQDNFDRIKEIAERVQIAKENAAEDTVDEAIREDREEVAEEEDEELNDLYQVVAGTPVGVVAESTVSRTLVAATPTRGSTSFVAEVGTPSVVSAVANKGATSVSVEEFAARGYTIL